MPIKEDVKWGKDSYAWHPDLVNMYGCNIGDNTRVGAFCEIRKDVVIGNNCRLQSFVFIPEGVTVGNDVFVGPHVCFTNDKHPKLGRDWEISSITVEDGASIGAGAVICPGVTIGKDAMVGAGAVVTKDVKSGTVVVGNPAKILRGK